MASKNPKAKRLLIDHLLLAFVHFQEGSHDDAAKVLQQASEIADVTDVVDEINEENKHDLDHDGDGGAGTGGGSGDEVVPDEAAITEMDEDKVQATAKTVAAQLRKLRETSAPVEQLRKHSRVLYMLHARGRAIKAAKEKASSPADRQAAALANIAKLKGSKK